MYFPTFSSKIILAFFIYSGLLVFGMIFTNPVYKSGLLGPSSVKFWMGYFGPALATGLILFQVYGGRKIDNIISIPFLWSVFGMIISSLRVLESGTGVTILLVLLGSILWLSDIIARNGQFSTAHKGYKEASEEQFVSHFTKIKSFSFDNRDINDIQSLEDIKKTTYFLERTGQKITLTSCQTVIFKEKKLKLIKFESSKVFGAIMLDHERQRASLDLSGKSINRDDFRSDIKIHLLGKISHQEAL